VSLPVSVSLPFTIPQQAVKQHLGNVRKTLFTSLCAGDLAEPRAFASGSLCGSSDAALCPLPAAGCASRFYHWQPSTAERAPWRGRTRPCFAPASVGRRWPPGLCNAPVLGCLSARRAGAGAVPEGDRHQEVSWRAAGALPACWAAAGAASALRAPQRVPLLRSPTLHTPPPSPPP
jgi:hypothetical protein